MQFFHFTPEAGGWTSNEATDSILWVGLTSDAQLLSRTTQPQYLASFFGISRCSDMDKGYQGKWKVELGIWHVRVLGKETHSEGCWDSTFFGIFFTVCVLIQYLFFTEKPLAWCSLLTFFWHLFLNSGKDVVLCNTVITCCEKSSQWSHGLHLLVTLQECLDLRVRNPIYHDLNCRWVTVSQTIVVFFDW